MKESQFEEITAALSVIIAILCWKFGISWLFYIYLVKAIWDTYCAIKEGIDEVNKERKVKPPERA